MSFVAVAIGGAGLLGAGASIYGSTKQSDAANNASQLMQQQMKTNSANAAPYIANGAGASNLLSSFYGIGPNGQLGPSTMNSFLQSPDYQFALSQGSAALNNSLASTGGALGVNAIKAQTQYASGLATQQLQNYMGRLSGLAGQGIQAGGNVAGVNTSGANAAGQDMMGGATAQTAGLNGATGAFNSSIGNYLTAYKAMGGSSYGGFGGSGATGGSGFATGGSGLSLGGTGGLY